MRASAPEEEFQRFRRVNVNVWLVLGAGAIWAFVRYQQGDFPLTPDKILLLLVLGVVSAGARTWIGLRDPVVMYSFTIWLAVYDLLLISVAVWATGGYQSEAWLLYFALLVSEAPVIPRRWLVPFMLATIGGYTLVSVPVPSGGWINLAFREAMLVIVTLFMHQVHRSHIEHLYELARLREQLQLGQERERIAREFHDGLGHSLINALMGLEVVRHRVADPNDGTRGLVEEQIGILRGALDEMRQVILQLHGMDAGNPLQRLRRLAQQVEERLNVSVHLNLPTIEIHLPPAAELVLIRAVQESLSNILKHARNVQCVQVEVSIQAERLSCTITDDGVGFDPQKVLGGFGLRNMADRIASLGGEFQVTSAPGEGTRVSFWIPYEEG